MSSAKKKPCSVDQSISHQESPRKRTAAASAQRLQRTGAAPRRSSRLSGPRQPGAEDAESAARRDESQPVKKRKRSGGSSNMKSKPHSTTLQDYSSGGGSAEDDSDSTSDFASAKGEDENGNGVGRAIQDLSRLEKKLRRNAKTQRLKVKASVGSVDRDVRMPITKNPRTPRAPNDLKALSSAAAADGTGSKKIVAHPLPTPELDAPEYEKSQGQDQDSINKRKNADHGTHAAVLTPDRGAARPPPCDSDYLPLPWKGRLGYACLNTYLRSGKKPVFSSRTCRMSSIIDHRYPLADPSVPEHPLKNRPDKSQKPDKGRGLAFVQRLGLANAGDISKMLRWNERYGIRFMRLSSEMFPFASHQEHGYKLAPFASEVLAEAGSVAAEYGHRLTTHPGQFTQLGSPRSEVIKAAVRDLEYHDEMLSLLRLPEQQNRDAVMILHMGGVYGDKEATLERFRQNYTCLLSDSIKRRLVLENDDVSWSVHDLLPVCEELNIPLVLDFHHHNIVFDAEHVREGTADIVPLFPRIRATWDRKGIKMKMHYSEPCAGAVTPRDRRKHSPRVATLPPCPPDVDLMIEAKDKEQAVFELMRNFRLPGYERIRFMIPNQRTDEPLPPHEPAAAKAKKSRTGKRKKTENERPKEEGLEDEEEIGGARDSSVADALSPPCAPVISDVDVGMGGPEGRVYWPPGMEEWLRPLKRDQKRKYEQEEGLYDGNPESEA